MQGVRSSVRTLWYSVWYLAVVLIVIAAVVLSLARILLPFAEQYKQEIEDWSSQQIGQDIVIGSLDAGWQGFEPQLILQNINFLSADEQTVTARFSRIRIGINPLSSLLSWSLVPGNMVAEGVQFIVVRDADSRIRVEGMEASSAVGQAKPNGQISNWLFSRQLLELRDSQLVWRDEKDGVLEWHFTDVNLRIENVDDRHLLSGSMVLPSSLGDKLEFAMDLQGNVFASSAWSGKIYMHGENLNLPQLLPDQTIGRASLSRGKLATSLWSEWNAGQLESARGRVELNNVQLKSQDIARITNVRSIVGDVAVEREPLGWRMTANRVQVRERRRIWEETDLDLRYYPNPKTIQFDTSYARISLVRQVLETVLPVDSDFYTVLRGVRPSGIVNDLRLFYTETDKETAYLLNADLHNVNTLPWKKIPGVRNVDASVRITPARGKVKVYSTDWNLNYPLIFSRSLRFSALDMELDWRKHIDGWNFQASHLKMDSPDLDVKGRFGLKVRNDGSSPFMDLGMRFRSTSARKISRYLPVGVMGEDLVDWMSRSIRGGSIDSGGVVFFGDLNEFPFRKHQGKFGLRFNMNDGVLDYLPGWPRVRKINGEFSYDGTGIRFHAEKAAIFSNRLDDVMVAIPDFSVKPLRLSVTGHVAGSTSDKLKFLHESPLEDVFAKSLHPFGFEGTSDLKLAMWLPLSAEDPEPSRINGLINFKKNDLLLRDLEINVTDIDGVLDFDQDKINSRSLKGKVLGAEFDLEVDTVDENGTRQIKLVDSLNINQATLQQMLDRFAGKGHWGNYFIGDTHGLAEIVIPLGVNSGWPYITFSSDMLGLESSLPVPLGKKATEEKKFFLYSELQGKERELHVHLGDIRSRFELLSTKDETSITRGGIAFGGIPELPAEYGYRVTGDVPSISWSEWSPVLLPEDDRLPLFPGGGLPAAQFYDVNVGALELFGARFKNVGLQASNSSQGWSVHVTGKELEGDLYLPLVWKSAPLTMDMERLLIQSHKGGDQKVELDPSELPELRITSDEFAYNGVSFGSLDLLAIRAGDGLRLQKLNLKSDTTHIQAKGNWIRDAQMKQSSRFDIKVNSKDFGKSFKEWRYSAPISGGISELDIHASWAGKPTDFAFERLSGQLGLQITGGRLVDIDPGASRLFGLLSLQALPRRLFLDFRDIFSKGMTFDSVKGEFDIESGNAFTTGLVMDGPAAKIDMAGRVGLVAEDYDQVVTIVPKTLDSLPLLGALAVEPTIGVTLFVMKKILQKQIDELSSLQYTVTGSWENPVVAKVAKSRAENVQDFLEE